MSCLELTWSKLFLSSTEIICHDNAVNGFNVLQWFTTSTNLMIVKQSADESLQIDLRADTDVASVEVSE
jgi:hypothetical protein